MKGFEEGFFVHGRLKFDNLRDDVALKEEFCIERNNDEKCSEHLQLNS